MADGEIEEFYVLSDTKLSGESYILVTDEEELNDEREKYEENKDDNGQKKENNGQNLLL